MFNSEEHETSLALTLVISHVSAPQGSDVVNLKTSCAQTVFEVLSVRVAVAGTNTEGNAVSERKDRDGLSSRRCSCGRCSWGSSGHRRSGGHGGCGGDRWCSTRLALGVPWMVLPHVGIEGQWCTYNR
jgi:hypothetical protein